MKLSCSNRNKNVPYFKVAFKFDDFKFVIIVDFDMKRIK